jgi:hypothetical protein
MRLTPSEIRAVIASVLSLVGGAVLLAITLIDRGSRRSCEVAWPAS